MTSSTATTRPVAAPVPAVNGDGKHAAQPGADARPPREPADKGWLLDLSKIDMNQRIMSRQQLESWNPHRGHMALVDSIVWQAADFKQGIGLHQCRADEFWASGHFPGRPLMPGVLQVEAAAQVAVYLFNARMPEPLVPAFTRIEDCSFRAMVQPGDDLFLICREVRASRRGFTCDIQGMVNGKMSCEARIHGLVI